MAAINMHALVARASSEMLAKRDNWASRNVGPMVVFCILGAVGILIIVIYILRCMKRRAQRAGQ
jgi:hypothetical protein